MFNGKKGVASQLTWKGAVMRSPIVKYKGLGFVLVLAFVLVVFAIAVAQNDSNDPNKKEVPATQLTDQTTQEPNEDSTREDVSATQPTDQATQEPNEDSTQEDVSATQPAGQTTQEPNEDPEQKDVPATQPAGQTTQEPNEDPEQKNVPATQPADQTTQEPNKGSTKKDASTTLQQRMLKTISIDCTNTPIEDVIRMLAEQANVDIIKSPTVTGNVTAKLTNVPLEEALNNILAVNGYGCVIDKNMIRVAPADDIAQKGEVLVSKVYRITYADVTQVETALKKFISKRGSISSNLGTSNIIVTDTSSSIRAIDDFIGEIDRITPQLMVEVRIYDVTSTDGFDIGTEFFAGRNTPLTTITDKDTFQRVDTATSPTSTWKQTITDTVDTIDPTNTGTITKTETTDEPGTTGWTTTDTKDKVKDSSESWRTNTDGTQRPFQKSKPFVGGSFSADTGGTIHIAFLDTVDVEVALSMLSSEVGAKLLANPRILVLDNETAEFKIISEIPYTETSQTSSGGSMTSISFKDVGVELKVTPHVTRDDMVRLHIVPEFGVVSEKGKLVGSVQTVPTVDTRKLDTKALIKNGQTVVLGGLRRRTVTQTVKKIPVLGDVPMMGTLFSNVSEEVKTNELLIFITPRILTNQMLSPREAEDFKATNFSNPRVTNVAEERAGEVEQEP